jgi:hypothetical protein
VRGEGGVTPVGAWGGSGVRWRGGGVREEGVDGGGMKEGGERCSGGKRERAWHGRGHERGTAGYGMGGRGGCGTAGGERRPS